MLQPPAFFFRREPDLENKRERERAREKENQRESERKKNMPRATELWPVKWRAEDKE